MRTPWPLLLLSLVACDAGPSVTVPPGTLWRAGFTPIAPAAEVEESARVLDHLDPDRIEALQRAECTVQNRGEYLAVESPRTARFLRLADGALGSVSRIAVEAKGEQVTDVVLLSHPAPDGTGERRWLDRQILAAGERGRIEFQLPTRRDPGGSLELAFHGPRGVELEFYGIDLLTQPATAFLPRSGDPAEPIQLGMETRPGVTLVQDTVRTIEKPRPGLWRFAAGVPVRVADEEAVRIVVAQGTRRLVARDLEVPGGWYEFEAEVQGEEPLELSLEGAPGAACAVAIPFALLPTQEPRTVVLVTTDTHRADHIGAARGAPVRTPGIDALAGRGVFFEDAGAVSNMTGPSHVTILTGVHPRDTGVVDNASRLADEAPTLQEVFAEAGFLTLGATSAWHLGPENGFAQGFDSFLAPGHDESEAIDALSWSHGALANAEGLDVFLWVHLFDPHAPYTPPEEVLQTYWPADRDPRDLAVETPDNLRVPSWARGVRDAEYLEALYRAEITAMDERLARFFDLPRLRGGLVALTADHGETLGLGPEAWDHGQLGPDTQRVPLVIAGPALDRERGLRARLSVGNADLGRTLLDLAGLVHAPFPGRNLVDLARDDAPPRVPRFGLASYGSSASIELDGWYLRLQLADPAELAGEGRPSIHHGRGKERHQVELFHLRTDPEGRTDQSEAEPERTRRLRKLLVSFLLEARPDGWNSVLEIDAKGSETLESLGYAGTSRATSENLWWDAECDCAWCERYEVP